MAQANTILVVDDDADVRDTLADVLQDAGYTVLVAADGAQALEQLQQHPEVRLIILDLMMPRMNGQQFLEARARRPELSRLPVILISADGESAAEAERFGVAGLRKPVKLQALLQAVKGHGC